MKKSIIYILITLLPLAMQAMEGNKSNHAIFNPKFLSASWELDNIQYLDHFFPEDVNYLFKDSSFQSSSPSKKRSIKRIKQEIKKLLAAETDINDKKWIYLLNQASFHENCCNLIESILLRGVNPNVSNIYDDTPLYNACYSGSLTNAILLLKYSADPNLVNNSGKTSLMAAIVGGNLEIIELLLKYENIKVNIQDRNGNTALMGAVKNGLFMSACYKNDIYLRQNVILALLNAKSCPYIKNKKGKNAIDIARENSFEYLAELMENYESEIKEAWKAIGQDSVLHQVD